MIKVFYMNEYEWWAGESLEQVKKAFLENDPDEECLDDPHELPKAIMNKFMFTDDDGTKRTFKKQLKKLIEEKTSFPCVFATTDW